MSMSSHCANKLCCCSQTCLPVLTWSASTFSSASLSWSERFTDTDTQLENGSSCSFIGALAAKVETFVDFLNTRTRLLLWQDRFPCSNNWIFGLWLGLLWVFPTSSNSWTQFFHPIVFVGNFWLSSRWLMHDFFKFQHNCFRDAINWVFLVEDDCVRSCLTELQSFSLSKLYIDPIHRI